MWLQMIVDPPGENRGFHRCRPRLRQCFPPTVQIEAGGGNRSFAVNRATAILYAVADRPLVHIQSDVIHRFHGGASLVFLNQRPLSSAFVHQALLPRPIHSNYSARWLRAIVSGLLKNYRSKSVCTLIRAEVLTIKQFGR